ncbi:hypothetical protein TMatcc_004225 [Talaromyces marneffei ATCC 18224]|uniref:uncharacterized protein n=1 Tax=Talaromyces marneffei TaxID=37727 RepID=UPI0012AA7118|nr:uncharacterized protein EYB26_000812 [Talaromyces marneffei]KAE8556819.1 hypothetical protein EYB25_001523 [Talaromyces marneffei]QGA13165.1 hypothetical protein EYB26_000812 [Talaromyces marneffei]
MFWLRFVEAWAINRLLRSPAFHQMVRSVHRRVERARHGVPPEEMGGTNIEETSGTKHFLRLFKEQIQDQLKGNPTKRN